MKHYLLCSSFLCVLPVSAVGIEADYDFEYDNIYYQVVDETAKTCKTNPGILSGNIQTAGNLISGDVAIPEIVYNVNEPYRVVEIANASFFGNDRLTSISIPNTVINIEDQAFYGCNSLTSVVIPNSCCSIGNKAFMDCDLNKVIIPPHVATIGSSAFAANVNLNEVIIGHGITSIGDQAFKGDNVKSIIITASLPPKASDDVFSTYNGTLNVTDEYAMSAYKDAHACWNNFNSTILDLPEYLSINSAHDIPVSVGDVIPLSGSMMPDSVKHPDLFWSTSNPDVATVDNDGNVSIHTIPDTANPCSITAESIYSDAPTDRLDLFSFIPTSEENISEENINPSTTATLYNILGIRIKNAANAISSGICIVHNGNRTFKVIM